MSETVLVAVLALVGTLGGSLLGILAANKLTNYRIEQLEKQLEKQAKTYNNLDARLHKLGADMEVVHEQIKVINHRIGDLESSDQHNPNGVS